MSLQRASIQVSIASIAVYLVSFINQLLIARTFGAGLRMDAYLAGSNVPLVVNNLVGAIFVYAMVPHIVHEAGDEESAKPRIVGLVAGCSFLAVATLVLGLCLHVLPLSRLSQFGAHQNEATWAAALSWGSCALFFLTALSDALFNAKKQFLFPVLAYLPAYLLTSIACFALGPRFGGPALAGATLVGYVLVVPLRILKQRDYVVPRIDFSMFKGFLRRIPYTALAVMSLYAFPFVDTLLGPNVGEGTLSILGYSTRIISTLAVIVALGPFGVLIPEIAGHSATRNRDRFTARAMTLFRYALTLLVPVAIWITIFRLPIIVLLLERGAFGPAASESLSALLLFNVPGSIFMVLSMLIVRVFLADKRVVEACILSSINLFLYFGLCTYLTPERGLNGFGTAFLSAWTIHAAVALCVLFSKDRGLVDIKKVGVFFVKLATATLALAVVSLVIQRIVPLSGKIETLLALPLFFLAALFVYFGIGHALGSPEHQRVWSLISRLARRSRSA